MIQVNIKKLDGTIGWSAQFEDQSSADSWIAQEESNNSWGKLARQIRSDSEAIQDEDLSKAVSAVQMADSDGVVYTLYSFDPDFTVECLDVTAEVESKALVEKGLQAQNFGAKVIAQVFAFNEANLTAGTITTQGLQNMLADTGLANIERMLWNGSLKTALALINASTTISQWFSPLQINAIKDMINNSGLV